MREDPGMPAVSTLEELRQAVADFAVTSLDLPYEPTALAAARTSLNKAGLLLLGEVHGVAENPLLIRDLMGALQITSLALEWPVGLTDTVASFLHTGTLTDHRLLWSGDGRIAAGHLRVLRDLSAAGPLLLTLFDPPLHASTRADAWTLCLPRNASGQVTPHVRTRAARRRDGHAGGWSDRRAGPDR
jgi:hypothetical protein